MSACIVCVCSVQECKHNPLYAVRMWFTECNNFIQEAARLLLGYHPLAFFLSLRGTHSLSIRQEAPELFFALLRTATMFPRVILKGTLIKKSQQKKRTSPCNYKERFFVLDTQDLKYSERRPGVSICIYLYTMFKLK